MKEFLEFNRRWQAVPLEEKMRIAMQTDSYNNQGVFALRSGDIEQSIMYFQRALQIMPINDDALYNLITCYKKKGEYEKIPLLWAKLYIVEPTKRIEEKIIGYSLLTLLIDNYENGYDMGMVYLLRLLLYIKSNYNISVSEEDISKVCDKINQSWNTDILIRDLGVDPDAESIASSSYVRIYRTAVNLPHSKAIEARKEIFNW
mgnify:CR=1 FL=1